MPVRPIPLADEVSGPYWAAARERILVIQRCARCSKLQYPPEITCLRCHHDELRFVQVSGAGRVYSFAPLERAFHAGLADELPFLVALVELVEDPSVRLFTKLVDVEPDMVGIGMAVTVSFEQVDGVTLPVFRPTGMEEST